MALLPHGNGCKRPWQLSLVINVSSPAGVVLCSTNSELFQFCINSPDSFLLCLSLWLDEKDSSLAGSLQPWGLLLFLRTGGENVKKEAAVGEFETRLSCNCVSPPPMTSAEWGISWDPEKGPDTQERSRSRVKLEVFGERFEGERHGDTSQWTSERWSRGSPDARHPLPVLAAFPRRGCRDKMRSGCGMRESGGGGWDATDADEGKDILHSFSMV